MRSRDPLIMGTEVVMGGIKLIVPALNFRQLQVHGDALAKLGSISRSTNIYTEMADALPVILSALQRNYPDLTEDELADMVDLTNYRPVFEAVMGVSGIRAETLEKHKVVTPGESKPDGETIAQ